MAHDSGWVCLPLDMNWYSIFHCLFYFIYLFTSNYIIDVNNKITKFPIIWLNHIWYIEKIKLLVVGLVLVRLRLFSKITKKLQNIEQPGQEFILTVISSTAQHFLDSC